MKSAVMFSAFLAVFMCLFSSNSFGQKRYWVGGSGDWTSTTHWSLTSGGAPGASVPTSADSVIFDALSSTGVQDTVFSTNTIDTVLYFNANTAVTMHFNLNLTVSRDFIGSSNPNCHFISPAKTLKINAITFATNTFTPNSTQIFSTLRLNATGTTSLSVNSNVLAKNKVFLENGVIDFNNRTLNAGAIISNTPVTDTRNFDLDSASFVILTDSLQLVGLTSTSRPKQVTFTNATNAILNDNLNANYSIVEFQSLNSQILQNTSIDSLIFNTTTFSPSVSHTLKIKNGRLLSFDNLNSDATCSFPLLVSNELIPLIPRAQIQYTGSNDSISLPNIQFRNIAALDSLGQSKYYVDYDQIVNSIGFSVGSAFYWIGNTGNWSDPAHWSKSSGGPAGCKIPQDGDILIFDQNSFSANNHTVTVDTSIVVGKMFWNTIDDSAHLFLERNIFSDGDVSLDNKLHVYRDSIQYRLEFNKKAKFSPDSSFFDCNLAINLVPTSDTVIFISPLNASDSSSIYHLSGRLNTNNQTVSAQAYLARTTDFKRIYLGSSTIYLNDGWDSDSLNLTYQVNAGTSHIYIGRARDTNYFTTNNKVFNNLTFDYNPLKVGAVRGDFTCNDLTITGGSMIKFQAGRTITMDSLIINGGCNKFKIDTVQLPILAYDTVSVDTLSAIVHVYNDTSTSNVFGFSAIPADTMYDYIYTINIATNDTIVGDTIRKIVRRAAIIDTIIGTPNLYIYLDSVTEYVININTNVDTTGYSESYLFGVDNDTLTGRQEVRLFSSISGSQFTFSSVKPQNVYGVSIKDGRFLGAGAKTAYFSTNVSGNSNWVFNSSPSTTADFSFGPSFCFGDTTHFTNNSTAFSGNFNDLIHVWDYDEHIHLGDTNAYVFENAGKHIVKLTTYYNNGCYDEFVDSLTIHDPTLFGTMDQPDLILCEGTTVQFNASAINDSLTNYQFYKNGVSLGAASLLDSMLVGPILDNDSISIVATLFGCPAEDTISYVFDVNANPVTVLTSSDADTTICATTSVTMTASGANLYQFFLNNTSATANLPGTTFIRNNLVDNDSVYVIGTNTTTGCKDTSGLLIFNVNPLPTPTLSKSIASNTICDGTSVTFTAGGAATYQFFVDGISTGPASATNTFTTDTLNSGNVVSVVGTTALGCSRASTSTYSFFVVPLPNAGISVLDADSSICQGETVSFNATGGSTYEYFVNATSLGSSGSSVLNTSTLANNDQIRVVVSFSGCTDTSSVIPIEVRGMPTTSLVSDDANDTICQLQNVLFTATGATNYSFSINGTQVQASSTDNTYATTSLTNGSTITVIGESNNCFLSDQIVFGVLGIPNVNVTSSDFDNQACQGDVITFTGSGAASYQLGIDGVYGAIQVPSAFPTTLTTGTHAITVRGIGANGCTNISTNTITTTINPNPTVSIVSNDANDTICTGTSVQFTGSGSTFYQFYVDNVSQTSSSTTATYTNSNLVNGQQIFVVGTSLGCIGRSDTITIGVNPIPVVALSSTDVDNVFCAGSPVTYTASGATNYEYFLNGSSQGAASPTATFDASSLIASNYTLSVTGTTNGCSSSDAKNVVVNAIPTVTMTSSDADNQFCTGTNVTLTGSGATNYEFVLNGTSTAPSNPITTFSSSTLANGNTLFVVGTTPAGCKDSSSVVTFSVNPTPTITQTSSDVDNTICSGTSVTFTATGGTSYEFLVNGVSQGAPSATNTFTTSTLTSGQTVTAIGTVNGCSANSNAISTTVFLQPTVSLSNLGSTNLCSNETTNIAANGALLYEFFINGVSQGAPSATSTFVNNVADGDVLTVSGTSNGCTSTGTNSFVFTVTPTPTVNLLSSDIDAIICLNDQVDFNSIGASEYTYYINGIPQQSGTLNTYSTSEINDGDVISVRGNNNQCLSTIQQITFSVNSMNLSAISPNLVCAGDVATVTVTGADLYEFFVNGVSQGAPSATNTFTTGVLNPGDEIEVEGTNTTTTCVQDLGYSIIPSVVPNTTISANGPTTFCAGDSVVLTSNFTYGNQWFLNGNPIAGATNQTLTVLAGGNYSLEHTAGGTSEVWSKGYNGSGTIGNGANINMSTLAEAINLTDVKQISAGYDYALALTNAGTVYAWGENGSGQLGNGTYTTTNAPAQVPTLANIQQIATTRSSCAALTNTGQLYVWGNNNYGQLGVGSTAIINFPFLLPSVTNVSQIVGGKDHFVILKTDGTVWTVGNNDFGQLGQGDLLNNLTYEQIPGLTSIVKIGSGESHSFAINSSDRLFAWGANVDGQLGLGDETNRLVPTQLALSNIKDATGGATHSLILTNLNEVYVSGSNLYGQLGDNTISQTSFPRISSLGGVTELSCGEYSSLVLLEDGRVFGSGFNDDNQIQPTVGNIMDFTQVQGMDGVTSVEAGKRTIHAIFGESNTCGNAATTVVVNTIATPTISEASFVLTSSPSNAYQWYRDGVVIPGATSQTYTVFSTGNYVVQVTDANGCSAFSDTIYLYIAGIDENEVIDLNIYPNPSDAVFTLSGSATSEIEHIEVIDVTGRIVRSFNEIIPTQLDLSTEQRGTYYVSIVMNGKTYMKRIVLVK